jgi:MFS family permease
MSYSSALTADEDKRRRLSIGFNNFAHAVDHYVMLIFPAVVLEMMVVYGKTYAELIAVGAASFYAFGLFSLPAGWLADRWSRRNMMVVFYIGCGVSLIGAALAPNLVVLGAALLRLVYSRRSTIRSVPRSWYPRRSTAAGLSP